MDADVAIVGVGSVGSMAAWQLSKKGISVLGFEQYGIGHDRSAAGGESRLFRTAYMEGSEYVPLLQESKILWEQLEKESGSSLLTLNGGLMIGEAESKVMSAILKSINDFDLAHERLTGDQARKIYPQFNIFNDDLVILDKNAGFIRPELAVVSATQQAIENGAKIKRYTKVDSISSDEKGVNIIAEDSSYKVRKLIVTTGAWTWKLLPFLKEQVIARRLLLTWFTPKDISKVTPDKLPIFARMRDNFRLTGAPTLDGSMVKASYTKDPQFVEEPFNLYRDVYPEELKQISESVEALLPGLHPDPVRASAYMDAYTPDNHAIVGELPNMSNVMIATGFSGHGFKLSPVIGKIISDICTDGKTDSDIHHLTPRRFNPYT
ncbi:N-methyl-L-tryptophan oxidase [Natribacillus halophilus]|uniref:Sarcosine oxidase n=1 Tax=Natribacillus halophilus TaxID=549003 RepID=A0A1G8P3N5_9BACI|nr:N-methyl-L-tryptophan oxidase [Natribacillus halophilus]SDI87057.1 sarcosine oxidase [Natribacillus halophilus]